MLPTTLTPDVVTSRPAVAAVLARPLAAATSATDPRLGFSGLHQLLGPAELDSMTVAQLFTTIADWHQDAVARGGGRYARSLDRACDLDADAGLPMVHDRAGRSPGSTISVAGRVAKSQAMANQLLALVDNAAAAAYPWLSGARRGPLDDELDQLITAALTTRPGTAPSPQWVHAMMLRLGGNGSDPSTLEAAAAPVGVTRERVRQVEVKVRRWFDTHHVALPQLDDIATIVADPIGSDELADVLIQAGLTRHPFTPKALSAVAELVGHPLRVEAHTGVVGADEQDLAVVRKLVLSLTTNPGAAEVDQVVTMLAGRLDAPAQRVADLTRQVVTAHPQLRWCDGTHTVFRGQGGNDDRVRMRNVCTKMLAVSPSGTLSVTELFEGYARKAPFRRDSDGRVRTTTLAAVAAFVADHPQFVVTGGRVAPAQPVDYHGLVGDAVATLVDILREAPEYVLDRTTLVTQAQERGVNPTTAGLWLTFNECLTNVGWAAWGLVGAAPSAQRIAALQEQVRSQFERAELTDGWDGPDRPWFSLNISRSLASTGVLSLTWHPQMAGRRFTVVLPDGEPGGTVSFAADHHFVWGWGQALRLLEASRGQRLRAAFDLTESTCHVRLES